MSDARRDRIKAELPLAFVLEQYDLRPVEQSEGKLHYHSPWREDEHPSLDIYWGESDEGLAHQRVGDFGDTDFPGGWSADVFGLISRYEDIPFDAAVTRAMEFWVDYQTGEWSGPELGKPTEKPPLGEERLAELLADRSPLPYHEHPVWKAAAATRPGLVASKNITPDKLFVRQEDGALVYVVRDSRTNEIRGISFRDSNGRKWQESGGSRWLSTCESDHDLYVSDIGNRYVIVEGETDLFATYGAVGDQYHVYAVPGAGSNPARVGADQIPERSHVVLALDPDGAGRGAATKWADYLRGRNCTVAVAVVPPGKDLAGMSHSDIRRVIGMAQTMIDRPVGLAAAAGEYHLLRPKTPEKPRGWDDGEHFKRITDWHLTSTAVLVDGAGRTLGYRGLVDGRDVELPVELFTNAEKLNAWAMTQLHRRVDTQSRILTGHLAQFIRADSMWVPRIAAYPFEGLHDGMYVWHGGWTGSMEAGIAPSAFRRPHEVSFPMDDLEDLKERYPNVFDTLLRVYDSADYRAILAWHGAAFIRPLLPRFPILHLVGLSGSGKTTLMTELHRLLYSTGEPMSAEALTQFALSSYLESSNTWPVWVDEYRATTSSGRRHALEAAILDSYQATARASSRGGSEWAQVDTYERNAPFAVSGEMTLTQTAHIERAVNVRLRRESMGSIGPAKRIPSGAIGALVIDWVLANGYNEQLPEEWARGMDAMERTEYNQRVLELGWHIMVSALSTTPSDVLDLQFDTRQTARAIMEVDGTARNDRSLHNAIVSIYDGQQNEPVVWRHKDTVYVSPSNLILAANRRGLALVSDNVEDLKAAMVEYYDAESARRKPPPEFNHTSTIRVMSFHAHHLGIEAE